MMPWWKLAVLWAASLIAVVLICLAVRPPEHGPDRPLFGTPSGVIEPVSSSTKHRRSCWNRRWWRKHKRYCRGFRSGHGDAVVVRG